MNDQLRLLIAYFVCIFTRQDVYYTAFVSSGKHGYYQVAFEECLAAIDLDNMTARSYGREYDSRRTLRDFETIREVAERHASEKDLHVGIIQVLVEQYIHADPWQREKFTQSWLTRVMKRERRDFFPDAMHVALNIERM